MVYRGSQPADPFAGVDRAADSRGLPPQGKRDLVLAVYGLECQLFEDDEAAAALEEGMHLLPWQGDEDNMMDRFDVRLLLDDLQAAAGGPSRGRASLPGHEAEDFSPDELEEERYGDLDASREQELEHPLLAAPEPRVAAGPSSAGSSPQRSPQPSSPRQQGYSAMGFQYGSVEDAGEEEGDLEPSPRQEEAGQNTSEEEGGVAEEEAAAAQPREEPFQLPFPFPARLNNHLPETNRLHKIIMQTARFVRSAGGQMEIVLRVKQAGNPNFGFLMPDHHLHPYYRWVLDTNPQEIFNVVPERAPAPDASAAQPAQASTEAAADNVDATKADEARTGLSLLGNYGNDSQDNASPTATQSLAAAPAAAVPPASAAPAAAAEAAQDAAAETPVGSSTIPILGAEAVKPEPAAAAAAAVPKPLPHPQPPVLLSMPPALGPGQRPVFAPMPFLPPPRLLMLPPRLAVVPPPHMRLPHPHPAAAARPAAVSTAPSEPPADIRGIIQKLVAFIKKHGTKFEATVRQKEAGNPRFGFLLPWNPYHSYYRQLIQEQVGPEAEAELFGSKPAESAALGSGTLAGESCPSSSNEAEAGSAAQQAERGPKGGEGSAAASKDAGGAEVPSPEVASLGVSPGRGGALEEAGVPATSDRGGGEPAQNGAAFAAERDKGTPKGPEETGEGEIVPEAVLSEEEQGQGGGAGAGLLQHGATELGASGEAASAVEGAKKKSEPPQLTIRKNPSLAKLATARRPGPDHIGSAAAASVSPPEDHAGSPGSPPTDQPGISLREEGDVIPATGAEAESGGSEGEECGGDAGAEDLARAIWDGEDGLEAGAGDAATGTEGAEEGQAGGASEAEKQARRRRMVQSMLRAKQRQAEAVAADAREAHARAIAQHRRAFLLQDEGDYVGVGDHTVPAESPTRLEGGGPEPGEIAGPAPPPAAAPALIKEASVPLSLEEVIRGALKRRVVDESLAPRPAQEVAAAEVSPSSSKTSEDDSEEDGSDSDGRRRRRRHRSGRNSKRRRKEDGEREVGQKRRRRSRSTRSRSQSPADRSRRHKKSSKHRRRPADRSPSRSSPSSSYDSSAERRRARKAARQKRASSTPESDDSEAQAARKKLQQGQAERPKSGAPEGLDDMKARIRAMLGR